jgi:hypothetical protein
MSILFHHYKELAEITSEVEKMRQATIVNNSKQRLMKDVKKEEIPAALDNYLEK